MWLKWLTGQLMFGRRANAGYPRFPLSVGERIIVTWGRIDCRQANVVQTRGSAGIAARVFGRWGMNDE